MYRFRFQSVLRYRQQLMDQKQRELAARQRTLLAEMSRLTTLERTRQRHRALFDEKQRQGLRAREMALFEAFFERLSLEARQQRETVHRLNQEAIGKREELLEAAGNKKTLEQLKAREAERFRQAERRREQLQNDEISVNKYARRLRHGRERDSEKAAASADKEGL